MKRLSTLATLAVICVGATSSLLGKSTKSIELTVLGRISSTTPGAQIVAHDPGTQRIFVVKVLSPTIDVVDIRDPAQPQLVRQLLVDIDDDGFTATSVSVNAGIIAVAAQAAPKTSPGKVLFFDQDLNLLTQVQVGALPDMVTFTNNGRYVLTANEGEPASYPSTPATDPEGSVSIIDLSAGAANLTQADVRTASFTAFNGFSPATLFAADNIRVFG